MKKIRYLILHNLRLFNSYKSIVLVIIFFLMSFLNIFHNINIREITLLDVIISNYGGYDKIPFTIIVFAKTIFPYMIFAYIIEVYINDCMSSRATIILLRVNSLYKWLISNFICIFIMVAIYFLIYDLINILSVFVFFKDLSIGKYSLNHATTSSTSISLYTLFLNFYLLQVSGVLFLSMIQLVINFITKRQTIGYILIINIYIFNYVSNLLFKTILNIKLYTYIIGKPYIILHFCLFNIILSVVSIILISYYFKRTKPILS